MTERRLTNRGPYANQGARLPALQAARASSGLEGLAKNIEALREWVEVRLGSRGDRFEKAMTLREFEQQLQPIREALEEIKGFDGGIESLRSTEVSGLPPEVTNGAFIAVNAGGTKKLYFGLAGAWREIQLTP